MYGCMYGDIMSYTLSPYTMCDYNTRPSDEFLVWFIPTERMQKGHAVRLQVGMEIFVRGESMDIFVDEIFPKALFLLCAPLKACFGKISARKFVAGGVSSYHPCAIRYAYKINGRGRRVVDSIAFIFCCKARHNKCTLLFNLKQSTNDM